MPVYDFASITPVQPAKELIDTVLYRTMRKTPTVVRKGFKISRIRSFYMLKVKFTQNTIGQKLGTILDEFPKVDEVHPFYRYWFGVLYEKRHYKTALAQISVCKQLVDKCGQHYVKLLKHADSLFQCKSLKIAALGRMATLLRKLDAQFVYLEEVRAHMSRLAAVDPSTRTVVLAGCPGAGKSSVLNALSHANVDVQPWAFTTKSLLLGHTEHRGLRFQIVDSPGLLDRPMAERNQIEMQTLTALAYLNSAILYIVDASNGVTFIKQQLSLFNSLTPFMENKPVAILLNKMDAWSPEELTDEELNLLQQFSPSFPLQESFRLAGVAYADVQDIRTAERVGGATYEAMAAAVAAEQQIRDQIIASGAVPILCCSATTRAGLERAAFTIMDQLLAIRAAQSGRAGQKEVTGEGSAAIPGLFVAKPPQAGSTAWTGQTLQNRPPVVPGSVQELRMQHLHPRALTSEDGRQSLLEQEREAGGSAKFFLDPRAAWILENEDERYDQMAFIHNGKNVMDFVSADEDILEMVKRLEEEEEVLAMQEEARARDDAELFARLGAFERAVGYKGPGSSGRMIRWARARAEREAVSKIPRYMNDQVEKAEAKLKARQAGQEFDENAWEEEYKKKHGTTRHLGSVGAPKGSLELIPQAKSMKVSAKLKLRREGKAVPEDRMPKHLNSGKMSAGTRAWR